MKVYIRAENESISKWIELASNQAYLIIKDAFLYFQLIDRLKRSNKANENKTTNTALHL
jgi:hypothetical protein